MAWTHGPRPLSEKFWEKVDTRGPDECWPWKGATVSHDRGYLSILCPDRRRNILASRISYELNVQPIPGDLRVLHKCDNPNCVNPCHLFLGTMKDNTRDMMAKGRNRCGRQPGEQSSRAKLTNEQAYAIRISSRSRRELGKEYGISPSVVGDIRRGRSYKEASHG